ncbi:hypothetical protein [Synechococcus sp. CCY 9618]|uniref:hypothetical protein n=1 Tax=Synechococcus sp. CCY 9618 TaxID=2815602 RepID=UPI001C236379|nr:hypothetical protein [Synechococcus sp. CCY 9618]
MAPGQIDPAVAPLRRANPDRFREARPGHLAVVAAAGRPWFIGRICHLSGPTSQDFAQVLNIDTGDFERIPAPWIVEFMGEGGMWLRRHPPR